MTAKRRPITLVVLTLILVLAMASCRRRVNTEHFWPVENCAVPSNRSS